MKEEGKNSFSDSHGNLWEWSTKCPLCNHTQLTTLYRTQPSRYLFLTDVSPAIVRCCACGLAWVNPRVVHVASPIYDYPEPDPDVPAPSSHHMTIEQIERRRSPGKLLDVGCGYGFLLKEAHARGWQVLGIEPNGKKASYGTNKLGLPIFNGRFHEANLSYGSFDVVVMEDVIEHLSEPIGLLTEVNNVLKDDGLLFIRTPDIESWEARLLRNRWVMFYVNSHWYFYSQSSLDKLLSMSRFETSERMLWTKSSGQLRNLTKWLLASSGIAISHLQVIAIKESNTKQIW